ncbi:MAG: hypothetical protein Greene041679_107 [Parcubacteria group bacterium Greene0416_79]|nr:MAG: hypothetical protein Greene041679_107 [Parcubacteria group bacterium Greene0416_79]
MGAGFGLGIFGKVAATKSKTIQKIDEFTVVCRIIYSSTFNQKEQ